MRALPASEGRKGREKNIIKIQCYGAATMKKIQRSLLPGVLVSRIFSRVLPGRIALGDDSSVDLTEQLAPNRDLEPVVRSGDFRVEIRTLINIHLFCP